MGQKYHDGLDDIIRIRWVAVQGFFVGYNAWTLASVLNNRCNQAAVTARDLGAKPRTLKYSKQMKLSWQSCCVG
eukprot:2190607-Amphidinium_carterae.2